ncbi:SNF2 domain-containing protein CLASSY 4-like isoform X2 [Diospyros lotus]|uniref:SNF2 domain-containing protein CLASSY 4-like isoform X2 n=1 Tax=Diospyros lotus TaxID=55363 RepID=UPI002258BE63|nr:SNF2 domain-containing protein CLASSY 4-like isoform X2 [Diospyros lotus]
MSCVAKRTRAQTDKRIEDEYREWKRRTGSNGEERRRRPSPLRFHDVSDQHNNIKVEVIDRSGDEGAYDNATMKCWSKLEHNNCDDISNVNGAAKVTKQSLSVGLDDSLGSIGTNSNDTNDGNFEMESSRSFFEVDKSSYFAVRGSELGTGDQSMTSRETMDDDSTKKDFVKEESFEAGLLLKLNSGSSVEPITISSDGEEDMPLGPGSRKSELDIDHGISFHTHLKAGSRKKPSEIGRTVSVSDLDQSMMSSENNDDDSSNEDFDKEKSFESGWQVKSKGSTEPITIISDGGEEMPFSPGSWESELEVDAGVEDSSTFWANLKAGSRKKPPETTRTASISDLDPSITSSETNYDDSSDKDFEVLSSGMEESSAYLEEVDEQEQDGNINSSDEESNDHYVNRKEFPNKNCYQIRLRSTQRHVEQRHVLKEENGGIETNLYNCRTDKEKCSEEKNAELRGVRKSSNRKQATVQKTSYCPEKCSEEKNAELNDDSKIHGTKKEGYSDEKVDEKSGEMGEPINRKSPVASKGHGIFRTFLDSILDKNNALEDEVSEQVKSSSLVEYTLPLKFKYEFEEPELVEKSDLDKLTDDLFAEMEFAQRCEEMGSCPPAVDNICPEAGRNQTILCHKGKHNFVLDEEIGIRCSICSYVELEIKYVMPSFGKNLFACETSKREYPFAHKEIPVFDGFNFESSHANLLDPCNHVRGTVWDIIPGIKESMYPHQIEGFEFLWRNLAGTTYLSELRNTDSNGVGGCIISHAPGTGKSRLTIVFIETFLNLFPNCRPIIIAPVGMLLTWEEEFRKWEVKFPFHNLNNLELSGKEDETSIEILSKSQFQSKDAVRMVKMHSWSNGKSILGISYHLFNKLAGENFVKAEGKNKWSKLVIDKEDELIRQDKEGELLGKILLESPGLVFLDEGHTPRNHRSRIWKTLLKLKTKRRIILSGTPFQNNFGELFNTLRLVRPAVADVFAKQKAFADMNLSGGRGYYGKQLTGQVSSVSVSSGKEVDDAIKKLKATISPFVHVHKGSILWRSLPGLRECAILLNPPQLQMELIRTFQAPESTFEFEHKVALVSAHPYLLLHCKDRSVIDRDALELYRLNPDLGVKTKFIMELVRLSVAMKEKVLIFSQYIDTLELIKDQLEAIFNWHEGKELLQIQGSVEQKYRQKFIGIFNDTKSEAKVMLASTKCCSEGISLVGASRVVLIDVVWNPSVERQAISRAYRLGQKKVVYTYNLLTSGTTEGEKYCRQSQKNLLSELVFSSTNKEREPNNCPTTFSDVILEEMVAHGKLKDMFEKIIYQPKETNLVGNFSLATNW